MIVSMWMTRDLVTIRADALITEAASEMAMHHVRRLPVVEDNRGTTRLIGMVCSHDLLHAFPSNVNPFAVIMDSFVSRQLVSEIMSRNVLTTSPNTPIEEAARVMRSNKVGALPVIKNGDLVGLITESDIFRAFISVMGADLGGIRITFDVTDDEDVIELVSRLARKHGLKVASILSTNYHQQQLNVVRIIGRHTDDFIEDIWDSGHKVLSVLT